MADKSILINFDFGGVSRVKGLPDGVDNAEPATVGQLKAAQEGLAWKDEVVVATVANLNLAAPGASIDNVALTAGDRILVKSQTDPAENGVYIWNGAATPATRAPDMNASAEFNSAVVPVSAGDTNAGTAWRFTVRNPTVGTTAISVVNFQTAVPAASESTAGTVELATQGETDAGADDTRAITPAKLAGYSGRAKRYATDFGDGAATSFTITHNLGTRDVNVMIRKAGGDYGEVICDVRATTTNTVTVETVSAPANNALRAIVTA